MIEQKFNDEWKFWIENNTFALAWGTPEEAETVTLPHDAMMKQKPSPQSDNGNNTGFRDGTFCNYSKSFYAPETYREKTIFLKFEGVYMNAFVYVNGQLAGKSPFGYNTFYVPLNGFLKYGKENDIRVQARNGAMKNSRWYSGGGIYRDVYLLIGELAYIREDSVQITTEEADDAYGVIHVRCKVKNRASNEKRIMLEQKVLDEDGEILAIGKIPVVLYEGEDRTLSQRLAIRYPLLWSDENPYLYTCISCLYEKGELIDESRDTFGIRTLQLDARRGLRVNHKPVALRGACIHHDSGLLGAATYEEVQFRQIRRLKEAGFNAVRMSHHPMAPAMLRACDRLGMYVMDETFDMWNRCKSDYDYSLYFQEWWEKDVAAMVQKDYNHPSVIMYSIGNEIPEIGTVQGAKITHELSGRMKELDSSRYTLSAVNGVFAAADAVGVIMRDIKSDLGEEGVEGNVNEFLTMMDDYIDEIVVHDEITKRLDLICASTDIAGYNYMTARYEPDGISHPDRIIVGSETYPPDIARNWTLVNRLPYVIGDFTWTGWDYIGEAGIGVPAYQMGEGGFGAVFPCQLAYCGDFDITGFRRPVSYFREIVFGLRKDPYIAVQRPERYGKTPIKTPWIMSDADSCWTFDGQEGMPVIVEVYAAGAEVELIRNGKSIGKKALGSNEYRVCFDTIYESGILQAISYDEKGCIFGKTEIKTAKPERHIRICPETSNAEGERFQYFLIEICDDEGTVAENENRCIAVDINSGAVLAGFGSGNPKPQYDYAGNVTETYNGRALLILEAGRESDEIAFAIRSETMETATYVSCSKNTICSEKSCCP